MKNNVKCNVTEAMSVTDDFCFFPFECQDQINIESKIKVVRFIGELVKFRMFSKIEALYCLKLLLHDFTHHHIEMCCSLLETCGRFLFRNPDSHQRTKVYLVSLHLWTWYKRCILQKLLNK
jgi:hypothetical protein